MKPAILKQTPEVLVMEQRYSGDGALPPEHLHPGQDERFTVLEGAYRSCAGRCARRCARRCAPPSSSTASTARRSPASSTAKNAVRAFFAEFADEVRFV